MRMQQPQLRRARIEIIPMIDTIFFLLVFFMVTWLSLVKMNGLNLLLPRHNQSSSKPPPAITLSVSPSGQCYLDKHRTASDTWQADLRGLLQRRPAGEGSASQAQVVVINVAPTLKTQTMVSTIDQVNRVIAAAGSGTHAQVLIATERVPTPDAHS